MLILYLTKNARSKEGVSQKEAGSVMSNISPSVLSGLFTATQSASKKKQQGIDLSDRIGLDDVMALMGGSKQDS